MVATVIPSSFFLRLESVRLGSFIKNINHPHEGYHEPPNNLQNSKTRFGWALTSLISAGFSKRLQSQIHLAPASGSNYLLDNSDAWSDRVVSIPDTRSCIEKAALRGDKVYIIVGIQTLTDTRIVEKSARGQAGSQVNVPISLSLTAANAVMPFAELVDPLSLIELHTAAAPTWPLMPLPSV
ncbi:hypothetical protein B0J13DRAFT_642979 [Dactylonectria estremocensis]|uniref:Uncharacterized protein n=1 Tax=Dactylonectria estremocensis TaxID=1079267 RepID=A0A9P9JFE8_9HYPO|nr:hypothetical protein B0J13DRAFT_642979 [Dactylonectria estremocensis]